MCNYKLKISITCTIYAVTALSKWALTCLIQVENSCLCFLFLFFNSFSLTSFGEVFTFFATWKVVRKFTFKIVESQVPKLPVASSSWLLTINRVVKINPENCTSRGHKMETQTGEPHELYLCENFGLSSKTQTAQQASQKASVPTTYRSSLQLSYGSQIYATNVINQFTN